MKVNIIIIKFSGGISHLKYYVIIRSLQLAVTLVSDHVYQCRQAMICSRQGVIMCMSCTQVAEDSAEIL